MRHKLNYIPLLALIMMLAGCATNSTVAPGNEALVVNTESTLKNGHETIALFLQVERENESYVIQYAPQIHTFAQSLRHKGSTGKSHVQMVEDDAWGALNTYKSNRDANNKATLTTYLATFSDLVERSKNYIPQVDSAKAKAMKRQSISR